MTDAPSGNGLPGPEWRAFLLAELKALHEGQDELKTHMNQQQGAWTLVKWLTGGSLIGTIVAVVTLLSHMRGAF